MNRRRNTRRRENIIPGVDNKIFYGVLIASTIIILICLSIWYRKNEINKDKVVLESKKINDEVEQIYSEANNEIGSTDSYKTDKILRVSFVGDIASGAKIENNNVNYDSIFSDAKEELKDADIAIGTYSSNVKTANEKEFAKSVYNSGVDLLSIATYSGNAGAQDVDEKEQNLREIGFDTVGHYDDSEEDRVKIVERRDVKIAVIAYTVDSSSNSSKSEVNLYDSAKAKEDLEYAKENAKFTIVMLNWKSSQGGMKTKQEENIANELVSNGANAVIGTNSNCLQNLEMVQGENGQSFIAYSSGNYFSEISNENSKLELILNMQIYIDKDGKTEIYKIDYTPMYMYDNSKSSEGQNRFKILNIKQEICNYEKKQEEINNQANVDDQEIINNLTDTDTKTNVDGKTYKKLKIGIDRIRKILGIQS